MIWTDYSVASANLNAGCLILIENSKFKWLHLPPHVFPQSYCSIHFHLDAGRWQNIQQESTGGYGDDFLYFILVQALGNFFNLPLYSINTSNNHFIKVVDIRRSDVIFHLLKLMTSIGVYQPLL
jgi:hypothetical protein